MVAVKGPQLVCGESGLRLSEAPLSHAAGPQAPCPVRRSGAVRQQPWGQLRQRAAQHRCAAPSPRVQERGTGA